MEHSIHDGRKHGKHKHRSRRKKSEDEQAALGNQSLPSDTAKSSNFCYTEEELQTGKRIQPHKYCLLGKVKSARIPMSNEKTLIEMGFNASESVDWESIVQPTKTCLYKILRKMFTKSVKTNLQVRIGEALFKCHMIVLQCYSKFFLECDNEVVIDLPEEKVTARAFEMLYQWMITDYPLIQREGILELIVAADFLKVEELINQCWVCLDDCERFGEDKAFMLYWESRKFGFDCLKSLMLNRITKFFLTLVASKEFLELRVDEICMLLSSSLLGVNSEIEVFLAAVRWFDFNWNAREQHLIEVMENIRFSQIPVCYLVTLSSRVPMSDEIARVVNNDQVYKFICDGIAYCTTKLCYGEEHEELKKLQTQCHFKKWVERLWIYDPNCAYHHQHLGCLQIQKITYQAFLEYLQFRQTAGNFSWQELDFLKNNILITKPCCKLADSRKAADDAMLKSLGRDQAIQVESSTSMEPPITMAACTSYDFDVLDHTILTQRSDEYANQMPCQQMPWLLFEEERQAHQQQQQQHQLFMMQQQQVQLLQEQALQQQELHRQQELKFQQQQLQLQREQLQQQLQQQRIQQEYMQQEQHNFPAPMPPTLIKPMPLKANAPAASAEAFQPIHAPQEVQLHETTTTATRKCVYIEQQPQQRPPSNQNPPPRQPHHAPPRQSALPRHHAKRKTYIEKTVYTEATAISAESSVRSTTTTATTTCSLSSTKAKLVEPARQAEENQPIERKAEASAKPLCCLRDTTMTAEQFRCLGNRKLLIFGGIDPYCSNYFSADSSNLVPCCSHDNFGDHVLFHESSLPDWTHLSYLPFGSRHHHAVVQCNGIIYLIGGTRSNYGCSKKAVFEKSVWAFNPRTLQWTLECCLPELRRDFAAVAIDKNCERCQSPNEHSKASIGFYVIGGEGVNQTILDTVWFYDIMRKKWRRKPSLNVGRYGFTAAIVNNEIWIAGGIVDARVCKTSNEQCGDYCDGGAAVGVLGADGCAVDSSSGLGGNGTVDSGSKTLNMNIEVITDTIECYSLKCARKQCAACGDSTVSICEYCLGEGGGCWIKAKEHLRVPRLFTRFCKLNDRELYIVGGIGYNNEGTLASMCSIDRYDFSEKTWYYYGNIEEARHGHAVIGYDERLFIVGGVSTIQDKTLSKVEVFCTRKCQVENNNEVPDLPFPISGCGLAIID